MKIAMAACALLLFSSANVLAECQGTAPTDRKMNLEDEVPAQIASEEGLLGYLESMPVSSPLRYLSADALSSFVASLRFNEKGVTSFSTIEMERELTVKQAHEVLKLLGAQRSVIRLPIPVRSSQDAEVLQQMNARCDDHHYSYQCVGQGTCKTAASSICTPKC